MPSGLNGTRPMPSSVERGDDVVFGFAPPQRVLALQGGDGLDGVGAADAADAGFGQSEVADLAGGDEVADGAGDVFDGDVRVDAVLVEEVDVVGAQPAQRVVGDLSDAFGPAVGPVGRRPSAKPNLVAITTWSRIGSSASPTRRSLLPCP